MKKLTSLLLASVLLIVCAASAPAAEEEAVPSVLIDGYYVDFGSDIPTMDDGAPMLPVRHVAGALGLKYSWYPDEGRAAVSDGSLNVELTAGQRIIKFNGAIFISDRDIKTVDGELCVSGATMLKLMTFFGFSAQLNAAELTVDSGMANALVVNGNVFKSRSRAFIRNGVLYMPLDALASGLELEYYLMKEEKAATLNRYNSGKFAAVDFGEGIVTVGGSAVENTVSVMYEGGVVYIDGDSALNVVKYFGGEGSYNKYKTGLRLSWDEPVTVKVNGRVTVFPDLEPSAEAVALRFPIEEAGLIFDAEGSSVKIIAPDGDSVTLRAGSDEVELVSGGRDLSDYLEAPAALTDGRLTVTLGDLVLIAEDLGFDVERNGGTVEITDPGAGEFVPLTPQKPVTVMLDGHTVIFPDVEPMIIDGRTLIPLRAVAEEMKMSVEWLGDGVRIENGGDSLEMTVGSAELTGHRDGEELRSALDVPVSVIDGRTCVPIRAIMEFFGAQVEWDEDSRTVIITSPVKPKSVYTRPVEGPDEYALLLGFTVDAKNGAANVNYFVANENTALVTYEIGNTAYSFSASAMRNNGVVEDGEFVGPRLSHRLTVNGVPTSIITGSTVDGPAAIWEVGSYKFSLRANAQVGDSTLLDEAKAAAATFVLIREVEPEPEEELDFSPSMVRVDVMSTADFEALGIIAHAPEESRNVSYSVWDGRIAEVSFSVGGKSYVLRAAVNGGRLFSFKSDFLGGEDNFIVGEAADVSTATVRRTTDGIRVGVWKWGDITFMLYSDDQFVTDPEFRQICSECGLLCGEVQKDDPE